MEIQRYRQRFNFWLDTTKDDDYELAETIDELKAKRQFIKTLRQAFALITSLRSGDMSVLLTLFPWVKDELVAQAEQIERLEALAQQFQTIITLPRSDMAAPLPTIRIPEQIEKPRVTLNEQAQKELSIQNTLAALNDF